MKFTVSIFFFFIAIYNAFFICGFKQLCLDNHSESGIRSFELFLQWSANAFQKFDLFPEFTV